MTTSQKLLLTLSTLTVLVSGLVYGAFKYFGEWLATRLPGLFPASDDPFSAIRHPLQPWALDLHLLAGPVLVFGLGWIFKDHVLGKLGGNGAPSRGSGFIALLLVAPMVLSGYLLQTVTREGVHLAIVVAHIGAGLLFAGAYGLHIVLAPKHRNGTGSGSGEGG